MYNRTRAKAEALARKFGVPSVHDDAEEMLRREKLDFVDIVTDVETHPKFDLKTLRLVDAAYESARTGEVVKLRG